MTAQESGIQAGLQQQAANNTLNVSNYDASMQTLQAKQNLANTAETYNAGGVLMQGSPLGMLEQSRQLAAGQINQIMQQGSLQALMQNTAAVAGINTTRSQLLGTDNSFTSGLANADVEQENVLDEDLSSLFGGVGRAAVLGTNLANITNNNSWGSGPPTVANGGLVP